MASGEKSVAGNKPAHVVKGNIFDALGFSASEASASVSNLLKGRISQVSIEKLLRYADRLHLETSIAVRPMEAAPRRRKPRAASTARRAARKEALAV
jgi:hypothetical protein